MPAWFSRIRKLRTLPAADRALLAQAAGALPLIAIGVKLMGVARLLRALQSFGGPPAPAVAADLEAVRRAAWLVSVAARRGPIRGNCVSRSLTLWWLLRRRGLPSDFRVGVRTDTGRLEAHAWIEYGGAVVNDRADVHLRFTPFTERLHA